MEELEDALLGVASCPGCPVAARQNDEGKIILTSLQDRENRYYRYTILIEKMSDEMKGRQFAPITFKDKVERDNEWCILNNLRSSFCPIPRNT